MVEILSSCRRRRLHPGCLAQVSVCTTEQESCQPARTRGSASPHRSRRPTRSAGLPAPGPVACGPRAWRARATVPATASLSD